MENYNARHGKIERLSMGIWIRYIREHVNPWRFSLDQWLRRRCRQERRFQWSQPPIRCLCCIQRRAHWLLHHNCCSNSFGKLWPIHTHKWHPSTEPPCTRWLGPAIPSSPRKVRMSLPGLCVLLHKFKRIWLIWYWAKKMKESRRN